MGIIRTQSIKNSIYLYIGIIIGAINTILVFPFVFEANPEYWGLLQLLVSYSIVISSFSHLGAPHIFIRYFPIFNNKSKLFSFILILTLIGFSLFLVAFLAFKPYFITHINSDPLLTEYIFLVFILVFSNVLFDLFNSVSRSHLDSTTPIFLNDVFIRISTFILLILYHFSIVEFKEFIYLYVASYFLKFIILFYIQLRHSRVEFVFEWDKEDFFELFRYGFYVILGSGAAILVSRVDMIMIEYYLDLKHVAYYGLAFFIGNVIKVPVRSMTSISNPLIATAFKENNFKEIGFVYKKSSINLLIISSFLFLLIWLNIDDILSVLPEKFQSAKYVVLFIGLSQVFNLMCGLNGSIIINSKYYRFDMLFNIFLVLLTVVTNIFLIPLYGIDGAAMATAFSVLIYSTLKVLFIYLKLQLQPFSMNTLLVLLLSVLIFFIVSLIPIEFSPFINMILKSILISFLFVTVVLRLKVSNDISDLIHNAKNFLYKHL